jgi:hypothetical protein
MDLSQLDVNLNTLDFYEIDHKGIATGIRHSNPVCLRQETAKRQGLDLNNIEFDSSIKGLKPSEIRLSSPRQSYKETGACLRCGSFGHWLAHCPEPARPSQDSRSASVSGKRVTIADNYDLDDLEEWDI